MIFYISFSNQEKPSLMLFLALRTSEIWNVIIKNDLTLFII